MLLAARDGDAAAWKALESEFDRVVSAGCRYAVNKFGKVGQEYLKDCKQESWSKLLTEGARFFAGFRSGNANAPHLFVKRLAYTTALGYLEKAVGRLDQPDDFHGGDGAYVIDSADWLRMHSIRRRLAESESPRNIAIFWLKHRDGMTPAEIAKIGTFGLSRDGVETVLDRILRDLKKFVPDSDPDPSPGGAAASKKKKKKDFGGDPPSHSQNPLDKNCPSALDLLSLVHGDLAQVRTEEIYLHLAECARCGGIVRDLVRMEGTRVIAWPRVLPMVLKVAAMLTLSAIGAWYASTIFRGQGADSYMAEAYTKARPFEWRLPDAGYGPVRVEMAESKMESSALQRAGIEVGKLDASAPGIPSTLASRGRLALMRHDADGAVAALERAFSLVPDDAEVESELGVAYALRARVSDRPEDYQIGIAHFDRVLGRAPGNLHALFNRGVTYRLMGRRADAAADFETYLKYDASSGWSREAREWLAQLKP